MLKPRAAEPHVGPPLPCHDRRGPPRASMASERWARASWRTNCREFTRSFERARTWKSSSLRELVSVSPYIFWSLSASAVVPRRDHCRELSELLDVVGTFHPSVLLSASLDRTDQCRSRDMADRQPCSRNGRSSIRPHLRSIRLLAFLSRNSTRFSFLP